LEVQPDIQVEVLVDYLNDDVALTEVQTDIQVEVQVEMLVDYLNAEDVVEVQTDIQT